MATTQELMNQLALHKRELTRQQILTLKGQALKGDADGAVKGLQNLLKRKKERSNHARS